MAARHSFILPEEHRQPAIKTPLKWEFERSQRTLVARMGPGPFLMGETMTVPDILLAHCLIWAGAAGFPIVEPALEAFRDRMRDRPAYGRAMAVR
jgi:glutathione S-transferase